VAPFEGIFILLVFISFVKGGLGTNENKGGIDNSR